MERTQKKSIVWCSRIFADSTLIKGFFTDVMEADKERALEALRENRLAKSFPADRFPSECWFKFPDKKIRKVPEIAMIGGFWVISENLKSVFDQFDMGQTTFYPTKLFENDRKTEVAGTHYCVNFAETKRSFLPEHSPNVKKPFASVDYYRAPGVPQDNTIALSSKALDGVDLWIEDNLRRALFLSDNLVTALMKAKLTHRLGLRKCRVLDRRQT